MAGLLDLLSQTWPARLAQDAWSGITAPRDAWQGKLDPLSAEGISRINSLAGFMVGTPGAPAGALGSSTGRGFASLQDAAMTAAQPGIVAKLPPPLSLMERTWQNYGSKMNPDDVLNHEATWGTAARLSSARNPEDALVRSYPPMTEPEAFAHVANSLWDRMGSPQRISLPEAKQFMSTERQTYQNPAAFDLRTILNPMAKE